MVDKYGSLRVMSLAVYLLWPVVTFAAVFFLQHRFPPFVRKTPSVSPYCFFNAYVDAIFTIQQSSVVSASYLYNIRLVNM
jgi:hypothetical protein